jgi:hemolysin activation/secretion protein
MISPPIVIPNSPMKNLILPLLLAVSLCAAPSDHDNTVIVPLLKGLVFVANPQAFQKAGVSTGGVSMTAVPLIDRAAAREAFAAYLGQPLTFKGLNEITSKVSALYKQANHPLVDVVAPEQDVSSGVIQIVVSEFRVGEVRVEGNRWFSENLVSAPITYQHGDTINTNQLLNQLDAANANPFRRVDLVYQPSSQPGYTDLVLNTTDRFPVTAYAGFDNSGTAVTGRSRWNLGATWGNALGLDQNLSYQFSASDNFFSQNGTVNYMSNSLNWTMPLRGGTDSLSLLLNYQLSTPDIGVDFGYKGKSGVAGIRYSIGLPRTRKFVETLQLGFDFKVTNNNLAFGGTQVSRTSTEIDQFPVAYAFNVTDSRGSSAFTTTLVYSPGGLTPTNDSAYFQPGINQSGIPGAMSRYVYWRTDFTRLTKLPYKGVYAFRALGQTSTTNLLYTEKLSAGGPDLLRGYDPNSVYGDRGVVISNELRTPGLKPWPEHSLGEAQFYTFWDYGHLQAAQAFAGAINSVNASSVGTGVRYELRSNFIAHVNYGRALIQLPNTNSQARNNFTEVALTVAY